MRLGKPKKTGLIFSKAEIKLLRNIKQKKELMYLDPKFRSIKSFIRSKIKYKTNNQPMSKKDFLRRNQGGTYYVALNLEKLGLLCRNNQDNSVIFKLTKYGYNFFGKNHYVKLKYNCYQLVQL